MVRLVFRPYTQVRRSICTSESLRASTRVSSGFTLLKHSSPSFGSQHARSYSNPSKSRTGRSMMRFTRVEQRSHLSCQAAFTFIAPLGFGHPKTCAHVRLLGPCFKTGRIKPFGRQQPWCKVCVDCTPFHRQMRTARSGLPPTTREQQDASPANGRVAPLASASTCTGAPKSITTPGEPSAYLPSGRIVHGWQLLTHYYEKCDGRKARPPSSSPFRSANWPSNQATVWISQQRC